MYGPSYARHLSGNPRHHRIGSQPYVSNNRNNSNVLATSLLAMPPTSMHQYMPASASTPYAPLPDAQGSLVASQSPSTFHDGHQHITSPNIPQAYPWHHTPATRLLTYAENQVPVSPVDAPQIYSSQLLGSDDQVPMPTLRAPQESSYFPYHAPAVSTPSLQLLGYVGEQVPITPSGELQSSSQLFNPSPQSLGYAEYQVLMPQFSAPQSNTQFSVPSSRLLGRAEDQVPIPTLGAPQESSHLPLPIGQSVESSSALSYGHDFQNQENESADSLPPVPEDTRVKKRKRGVSSDNDTVNKRQNPAVSSSAVIPTQSTSRKPKKADYDPKPCPYCHIAITRPRRLRMHVREKCLKDLILTHEVSEREIGQGIKKWGPPRFFLGYSRVIISDDFPEAHFTEQRKHLEKLLSKTSDDEVVQVLIDWGVPAFLLRNNVKRNADEESTSQDTSYTRSFQDAEAYGSNLATENSTSPEPRVSTPPLSDTYETSSNFSFPSYYSEASPPTANSAGMPLSGAETQASLDNTIQFWFGQGAAVPRPFGQNEMHPTEFERNLASGAIMPPQYESGAVSWLFNFIPPAV